MADEKGQANQASIAESLSSVQTRDPKIQVVPDSKPQVQLTGANDPQQNAQKRADAMSEVGQKYQEAIAKIQQGPGPEKVQPLKFSEKKNIELALNPVAVDTSELPAFKEYKGYGLPANVQTKFDELHKPKMQAATAAAKAQMDSAAQARDQKRDQEISGAKSKAKEQNRTAQQQQRTEVSSARGRIAAEKQKTQAQYAVDRRKLENDTKSRGDAASGKIKARADADQRQIDASYQQAEQQAKAAVEQGEHQAAEEKKKAERESQHKSWWQKAVSFVSDMISKLADSVCKIFDEIRNVVAGLLDKAKQFANAAIDAAARFIKDTIKEFGDFLKSAVNNLLGAVFPELARKLNDFIDRAVERAQKAVQQVADRLKEAVNQLVNALKAALDAVVGAFKAAVQIAAALAKAVISGNWAEVAKLALEAVLRLAGIDPSEFYAMVGDVADTIKAILKNPGGFIGNLIKAGAQGFRQFANNFSQHLKSGLIQWLTGAAGDIGIQMPVELSAKGIFGMTAQVLGLSFDHLKKMLTEAVKKKGKKGEKAAAMIEKAEVLSDQVQSIWEKVQEILSGGWSALWDMLSGYLDGLYEMVIGGIRNFLIQKVVMAAVQKLATMWNPIGAIVQAVLTAYNMYCWLRDNLQRIMGVVQAIFGSMKAIIGGNIGAAAGKVESVLAGLVPVAIDLLANILNIGGIGHKVREVIEKVRGKVQTALQKVVDKLVDKFWGLAERVFTKSSGKGKNSKPDASNHPMPSAQPEPAADQKDPRTMAEKEQAVDRAVTEAQAVVEDSHVSSAVVAKKLSDIKAKHKLVRLELDVKGGEYSVEAEINPKRKRAGKTTTKKQHEDQRAKVHYEEDFSTLSDSGKDRTLAAMKELKQLPGRDGEKLTGNLAKGYLVIHCGGQEFTVSMFGQDVTPVFSSGSGAGVKDTGLKIHDASKRLPHSKTQDGAKETDQVLKPAFVGIHSESPGAVVLVTNPAELQKFMEKTNQLDHRPSYVKEMKKPVEDRKDNPGFSPSTDKHSEQAFWQAMRANDSIIAGQIKAQRKIRGLSEVKIDKFEVHIHSERQMCRQCALASNETMHNLEIHLPKTAAVVKEAQRLVSVTSHQAFAGAAPQIKSTGEPDETDLVAGITAPPKNHVRAYPFVDQSSMKHLVKGSASKPGHKHKQS